MKKDCKKNKGNDSSDDDEEMGKKKKTQSKKTKQKKETKGNYDSWGFPTIGIAQNIHAGNIGRLSKKKKDQNYKEDEKVSERIEDVDPNIIADSKSEENKKGRSKIKQTKEKATDKRNSNKPEINEA